MEFYFEINAKISRLIRFIYFMECHTRNFFQGRKNEFVIWKDGNVENVKLKENKIIKYRMKDFYTLIFFYIEIMDFDIIWQFCIIFVNLLTRSATPPGRIVLTTTPLLRPPTIPNPRPLPSLIRFITSTCAHSVFSYNSTNT